MKIKLLLLSLVFSNFNLFAQQLVDTKVKQNLIKSSATFEENKGQMKDHNWLPQPDVLYYGSQEGMNYYIKNNGVSFQLSRVDSWREEESRLGMPKGKKSKVPDQISTYRVDAHWIEHNPSFIVLQGKALDGYNNYYNVPDGVEPALFVKQFESVVLKNVWNGIDINYYGTNGLLETDYLVSPGSDYRDIQIEIKGAELSISTDGNLIMKTPFGEIQEGELKVYQGDERLQAYWKIEGNNKVSFVIPNFNPFIAMRIDPVTRFWGTYYGGSGDEFGYSNSTDALGNVYLAGVTSSFSAIASGGHQNTFGGIGGEDAFLVKFDSNGVRLWGTYYGGSNLDCGNSTTVDAAGNVYLAGYSYSTSGIASGGHQNTSGLGGADAFLVKFNGSGIRQWATYYGGSQGDGGTSTTTDGFNVYLAGYTRSASAIASGGHQNNLGGIGSDDGFLVKFNSNGVRLWGTYYGGSGNDTCYSITTSGGNVYISGIADSPGLSFNGHQNTFTTDDAFLVKFNSNGVRQWATYYGGSLIDNGYSTAADANGNVYLAGQTGSTSSIAFGGHQNTSGGGTLLGGDAFLVKFNSSGVRQWGTYYGGSGPDYCYSTKTDNLGNVYIVGCTGSTNAIASSGFQNTFGGGATYDAFLVKFNSNGVRQWGTYYGSNGNDICSSLAINDKGNFFLAGSSSSSNGIASGAHQTTLGGGYDAFLVKFVETFITVQPPLTVSACANSSINLGLTSVGTGLSYQWQIKSVSSTQFSNIVAGGSNNFSGVNTSTLIIGNVNGLDGYSIRCIVSNTLSSEISSTSVLTVYPPAPIIFTQPTNTTICSSLTANFSLAVSGSGYTYQWQYGNTSNSFTNIVNGGINAFTGANSSTLGIGNTTGIANYFFRCIVGNNTCPGTTNSNTVQLFVFNQPVVTNQPISTTTCPSQIASFSVTATGTGLVYQWQYRQGTNGAWSNCTNGTIYSGSTNNSLQIINPSSLNNYDYRCIVTNSNGCTTTSNSATLSVSLALPANITVDGVSANPVNINFGDVASMVLNGSFNSSNSNIVWTPTSGLSSNTIVDPFVFPSTSTTYSASFINSIGCPQTVTQQINVNSLPNNGAVSVSSVNGLNNFNVFDTLKVQVRLIGVTDIYGAYAKLKYSGVLAPYLNFIGYTAGTILGSGASVISTPPVASGTYVYDFGISKIGAFLGYAGTGTLYTFYFLPSNLSTSLVGNQVCFYVDNLTVNNATSGSLVGLVNQGPCYFTFNNQTNVWPGDLDNNKTVNTADLLKIGVFYNNTGPMRPNSNLQWVAQPTTLWGTNFTSPNSDAFKAFADGNGDGIINNADQASVGFNLGKTHALAPPIDSASFDRIATTGNLVVVPTPGYVSASAQSQQLDLSVSLANAGSTLNNLYGISFDIAVDTNVFDLQNTTFDYSGSIFGIPSQNFLKIEYVANGVVSVGMTRFNNPSVNGNGLLCKIRLNTYPALNYSGTNLTFNGTVSAANDSIGMPYAIGPASVQIPYGSSASISEIRDDNSQVILYPNPAGELLNVMINEEVFVKEIKVLDEIGRVVIIKTPNSMIAKYTIETLNLAEGIYTIQLITKVGQIYKKFVKGE